ncbi:hypothetical protein ElyMa_000788200 [Elysia marginata]|uniref:Uncharacterized protein n=1 Tax=Elysia marginata TaxID=1093978 RepID=A0AAV4GXG0_9GAST|nr:hypothetical protein ElyMa_000788200 [Elysia marginata]
MILKPQSLTCCVLLGILFHPHLGCWGSTMTRLRQFKVLNGHRVTGRGTEINRLSDPTAENRIDFANWTLVFRLQSGKSDLAYATWINDGRHDDAPLAASFPVACLRMFDYASCDRHFRSRIIDDWNGISEVSVATEFSSIYN